MSKILDQSESWCLKFLMRESWYHSFGKNSFPFDKKTHWSLITETFCSFITWQNLSASLPVAWTVQSLFLTAGDKHDISFNRVDSNGRFFWGYFVAAIGTFFINSKISSFLFLLSISLTETVGTCCEKKGKKKNSWHQKLTWQIQSNNHSTMKTKMRHK